MKKNKLKPTKQTNQSKKSEERKWYLIDLEGKILGRVVSLVTKYLIGKEKPTHSFHIDDGNYVIAINAKKIKVSGKKNVKKIYTFYSGYPSGLKKLNFNQLLNKNPKEIIRHAVSGMLPKNKHRKERLKRLFIFEDEKNPFTDKNLIKI